MLDKKEDFWREQVEELIKVRFIWKIERLGAEKSELVDMVNEYKRRLEEAQSEREECRTEARNKVASFSNIIFKKDDAISCAQGEIASLKTQREILEEKLAIETKRGGRFKKALAIVLFIMAAIELVVISMIKTR